jgi:hypothetical protein
VKRRRRLRRLVPDAGLIRRRAAGEPLRALASDYGVVHTTLLDYFERPEVARELKQAERQLRAERKAAADRLAAERRLERVVRRKAREQAAREAEDARRVQAVVTTSASRRRRARTPYEAWLDEHDERRPLTRADLRSQLDALAVRVVAEGGGMQAVLEATGLRTLENVAGSIDPAILKDAYDNDLLGPTPSPPAGSLGRAS